MESLEITTKEVSKIIRDLLWTETESEIFGITGAAEEMISFFGWQEMSDKVPKDRSIDLLSNGAIRFTNCRFDPKTQKWVSLIRYLDDQNLPRSVYNTIKNPTHFLIIPQPIKYE